MADDVIGKILGVDMAATVEGPMLPDVRWLIRAGWDGPERVLQQAVQMQRGFERWIEWRDVPTVEE